MEEHPLLRAVTNWPGRRQTQLAFEARGFSMHREWQNRIIQFCGEQQSHLLNRYWDEAALETMQCLGRCIPDQRVFLVQPMYRSSFLDELFAARDFVELPYRQPPLLKCLLDRIKRIDTDDNFQRNEVILFKNFRKAESERLDIETTGWSGRKRDVVPFVERFCAALGFESRARNRWRKKVDTGLVFEVGVDLGGNPFCITPPLIFRMFHADDPKYAFEIGGAAKLDLLVPGAYEYARCGNASEYVLGIKALIELFGVIVQSLEDS